MTELEKRMKRLEKVLKLARQMKALGMHPDDIVRLLLDSEPKDKSK